jgi:hypothetical protein
MAWTVKTALCASRVLAWQLGSGHSRRLQQPRQCHPARRQRWTSTRRRSAQVSGVKCCRTAVVCCVYMAWMRCSRVCGRAATTLSQCPELVRTPANGAAPARGRQSTLDAALTQRRQPSQQPAAAPGRAAGRAATQNGAAAGGQVHSAAMVFPLQLSLAAALLQRTTSQSGDRKQCMACDPITGCQLQHPCMRRSSMALYGRVSESALQ